MRAGFLAPFVLLAVALWLTLRTEPESFASPPDVRTTKLRNLMAYLGLGPDEQTARTLLQVIAANGGTGTSTGIYEMQNFLKSKAGFAGKVDGVVSPEYVAAYQAYVARFTPTALQLAVQALSAAPS